MLESDPILKNDHTWYDMTREEQMETLLKKSRRVYEIDRKKYFQDVNNGFHAWFHVVMKGIVKDIFKPNLCLVSLWLKLLYVYDLH